MPLDSPTKGAGLLKRPIPSSGVAVIQPLLFSIGQATPNLFDRTLLGQHVELLHRSRPAPINRDSTRVSIARWSEFLQREAPNARRGPARARALTETNLEQSFNIFVLGGALGYVLPGGGTDRYSLLPKDATRTGIPDAGLGFYSATAAEMRVLVELKGPGTDLDAPQSRQTRESPVEQAFRTASAHPTIRWIVVSNLDEVRLYNVSQPGRFFRFYATRPDDHTHHRTIGDLDIALSVLHASQMLGSDATVASNTDRLFEQSDARSSALRGGFYDLFSQARKDLYEAILATLPAETDETRVTALAKAQKLLDRIIFIRFCEDHPANLLPRQRLQTVVRQAPTLPGRRTDKVYRAVRDYFEEIREGSVAGSPYTVFAYDGELFDDDRVLDSMDLDDALFNRIYQTDVGGQIRRIRGPFGFWEYDFAHELNEHLLGHIYEQSLSDLKHGRLSAARRTRSGSTAGELRARYGIWYTPETLTTYLASIALTPHLDRLYARHVTAVGQAAPKADQIAALKAYYDAICHLRILDPACGSGAFLVSCFEILAGACTAASRAIEVLEGTAQTALFSDLDRRLLQNCLHGIDLNHEAVAITKLALWLKTATNQSENIDLSDRIVVSNSLDATRQFSGIEFDLVVGNPPWGAEWTDAERASYKAFFEFAREDFSSEEAFIKVAARYMKPGGTLAYVLPDTILHPDKLETRQYLLNRFTVKNISALGPEWFTAQNRMSAILFEGQYTVPPQDNRFGTFVLVDRDRKRAIAEELSLFQAQAIAGGTIPQARCITDGERGYEIRLFQRDDDDDIMRHLESVGAPLYRAHGATVGLCSRGRGVELNKEGLVIACPACGLWSPPGIWSARENRYLDRTCSCGHKSSFDAAANRTIVHDRAPRAANEAPFIDGDAIHRYTALTVQAIELDVNGIRYKKPELYRPPKVVIRQAGLGINAVLDTSDAYCPQSVYIYRVIPGVAPASVDEAYITGVLSSRVMHYYLFKRYSEIDSARAHIKVTHTRLAAFPIPVPSDAAQERLAAETADRVRQMMAEQNSEVRYRIDWEIEDRVASLFGLTASQRAYMNGQFGLVHENETIQALFPHGTPRPIPLDDSPLLVAV
jgi:type I restriction-modification system DNA methylase subunit